MDKNSIKYILDILNFGYMKQYCDVYIEGVREYVSGYVIDYIWDVLVIRVNESVYYIDINKITHIVLYNEYKKELVSYES